MGDCGCSWIRLRPFPDTRSKQLRVAAPRLGPRVLSLRGHLLPVEGQASPRSFLVPRSRGILALYSETLLLYPESRVENLVVPSPVTLCWGSARGTVVTGCVDRPPCRPRAHKEAFPAWRCGRCLLSGRNMENDQIPALSTSAVPVTSLDCRHMITKLGGEDKPSTVCQQTEDNSRMHCFLILPWKR